MLVQKLMGNRLGEEDDIRLEFRQLEDRVEQLSEFYVVEEIGIAAIVK